MLQEWMSEQKKLFLRAIVKLDYWHILEQVACHEHNGISKMSH